MVVTGARVGWVWRYSLLLCALAACLAGCTLGDILTPGPSAYEITDAEVIGTWAYHDGPGNFVFAGDKTFIMAEVPAGLVMIDPEPGELADGSGSWEITGTAATDRHISVGLTVYIGGQSGAFGASLIAYKSHGVLRLCGRGYCFTRPE